MEINIKLDKDQNRFLANVEGHPCVLDFRPKNGDVLEYYRTFVPENLRHNGIASKLTRYALEYAKEHNKKVIPTCSYIKSFIEKNPEYKALIKI